MTADASSTAQPSDMPHLLMMVPFLKTVDLQKVSDWLEAGAQDMPRLCHDAHQAAELMKQDNGNLLVLSPAADEVVATAVQDGMTMDDALTSWRDACIQILDVIRKNRRRTSVVGFDALRADPVSALATGGVVFAANADPAFPVPAPDEVLRIAAQAALRQNRDTTLLAGEWQAASACASPAPQADLPDVLAATRPQKDDPEVAQAATAVLLREAEMLRNTLTKEMEKVAALDARTAEQEKQQSFMERELSENRKERDALLQQLIKSQEALIALRMDDSMARDLAEARHELRVQKELLHAAQAQADTVAQQARDLRTELTQETGRTTEQLERIRDLEQELSAARTDLLAQQAAAQAAQAKVAQLDEEIQALRTTVCQETEKAQAQIARSRVLEQDLSENRQEKDSLLRQLMKTHEAMVSLRLSAEDNARLRADLETRKTRQKQLEADLNKARKDEQKQREEAARLKSALARKEKDIARILGSSSMRLTAPLRKLRALLGRRR